MARARSAVTTELATHTKVALGFVVATASVVIVSAVATMILTLVARPAAPTTTPAADRTFRTQ